MVKRLEIVVDDAELARIEAAARASDQSVPDWSRAVLTAASTSPATPALPAPGIEAVTPDPRAPEFVRRKLAALDRAQLHRFPAPAIDQMLREIDESRWS